MKLIIISGRSGSGKSTVLHTLEDMNYHCIDNFPVGLLPNLVEDNSTDGTGGQSDLAVGVDVRSAGIERFSAIWSVLSSRPGLNGEILYLNALSPTLVKRFSETRRQHPLTDANTDLRRAIDAETVQLADIAALADLVIDTTQLKASELVSLIKERIAPRTAGRLSLLFHSFAFKFGVPVDADFVFDLRCLPNPYWVEELRFLNGLDAKVQEFLSQDEMTNNMLEDITVFLNAWLPKFEDNNQAYLTVGLGCTGGQHRSVYMGERLGQQFKQRRGNVLVRHREIKTEHPAIGDAV